MGIHLLDKSADHLLGGIEVGDDTVAQRADGAEVLVGFLMHQASLLAHGQRLARLAVKRHNAGLVDNHLVVMQDNGVGGTQVHRYLLCK